MLQRLGTNFIMRLLDFVNFRRNIVNFRVLLGITWNIPKYNKNMFQLGNTEQNGEKIE